MYVAMVEQVAINMSFIMSLVMYTCRDNSSSLIGPLIFPGILVELVELSELVQYF